jgi:hypothetical protein
MHDDKKALSIEGTFFTLSLHMLRKYLRTKLNITI